MSFADGVFWNKPSASGRSSCLTASIQSETVVVQTSFSPPGAGEGNRFLSNDGFRELVSLYVASTRFCGVLILDNRSRMRFLDSVHRRQVSRRKTRLNSGLGLLFRSSRFADRPALPIPALPIRTCPAFPIQLSTSKMAPDAN